MGAQVYNVTDKLVLDHRAREWCKLPYPDHPHGCPNYGNRSTCPPAAPWLRQFIDILQPHYFVVIEFDLGKHVGRMITLHPSWSLRQARCCLYWQGAVNKILEDAAKRKAWDLGARYTLCPEAMGVHVIQTAQNMGIPIIAKPEGTVYKIALVGFPNSQPMWSGKEGV